MRSIPFPSFLVRHADLGLTFPCDAQLVRDVVSPKITNAIGTLILTGDEGSNNDHPHWIPGEIMFGNGTKVEVYVTHVKAEDKLGPAIISKFNFVSVDYEEIGDTPQACNAFHRAWFTHVFEIMDFFKAKCPESETEKSRLLTCHLELTPADVTEAFARNSRNKHALCVSIFYEKDDGGNGEDALYHKSLGEGYNGIPKLTDLDIEDEIIVSRLPEHRPNKKPKQIRKSSRPSKPVNAGVYDILNTSSSTEDRSPIQRKGLKRSHPSPDMPRAPQMLPTHSIAHRKPSNQPAPNPQTSPFASLHYNSRGAMNTTPVSSQYNAPFPPNIVHPLPIPSNLFDDYWSRNGADNPFGASTCPSSVNLANIRNPPSTPQLPVYVANQATAPGLPIEEPPTIATDSCRRMYNTGMERVKFVGAKRQLPSPDPSTKGSTKPCHDGFLSLEGISNTSHQWVTLDMPLTLNMAIKLAEGAGMKELAQEFSKNLGYVTSNRRKYLHTDMSRFLSGASFMNKFCNTNPFRRDEFHGKRDEYKNECGLIIPGRLAVCNIKNSVPLVGKILILVIEIRPSSSNESESFLVSGVATLDCDNAHPSSSFTPFHFINCKAFPSSDGCFDIDASVFFGKIPHTHPQTDGDMMDLTHDCSTFQAYWLAAHGRPYGPHDDLRHRLPTEQSILAGVEWKFDQTNWLGNVHRIVNGKVDGGSIDGTMVLTFTAVGAFGESSKLIMNCVDKVMTALYGDI